MRIYLAARYSRREELCGYRSQLEALGHIVTSRWLNGNHQISDTGKPIGDHGEALVEDGSDDRAAKLREHFAKEDFFDVLSCDLLIAFTEVPRSGHTGPTRSVKDYNPTRTAIHVHACSRGGRHVELGIALGTMKQVWIVGPRENVFCWLSEVQHHEDFNGVLEHLS